MRSTRTASLFPELSVDMVRDGTIYMRTTPLFYGTATVTFADGTRIRHFSSEDCSALRAQLQRRNVFARHAKDRDFYFQRAAAFAEKTVIEVVRLGAPDAVRGEVADAADTAEQVTLLAAALILRRDEMLSKIGIGLRPAEQIELLRGPNLTTLRAKTTSTPKGGGISLDPTLAKRVRSTGLASAYATASGEGQIARRLRNTIAWLSESKREPKTAAAIVKTAIAFESMLILDESESLARSLSERMAFLLTDERDQRRQVAGVVKRFYDARSGIVHGSKKKRRFVSAHLLDAVDRLLTLALTVLAAGEAAWPTDVALRDWCESERWGQPQKIHRPFAKKYLAHALDLYEVPTS